MAVQPIPEGCNSVNVYLIVKDARAAMDFWAKAFGGKATCCMEAPDGTVMHGEVIIGNSTVMVSQENEQWDLKAPETLGGSPASLHIYTEDCDASFQQALDAGCTEVAPVMDTFWGDRYGKDRRSFRIPMGNRDPQRRLDRRRAPATWARVVQTNGRNGRLI